MHHGVTLALAVSLALITGCTPAETQETESATE